MPTKRRRLLPQRINQQTPLWAQRLINEGVAPQEGEDGSDGWFGWLFCGDAISGLPSSDSPEGTALWSAALKHERPGFQKPVQRRRAPRQDPRPRAPRVARPGAS